MKDMTRAGVCYNFEISPYRVTKDMYTFVFSSQLHVEKFKEKYKENRDIINYSLTKRFGFDVCFDTLADVVLYRKIEKRGFLIINEYEQAFTSPDSFEFDGAHLFLK